MYEAPDRCGARQESSVSSPEQSPKFCLQPKWSATPRQTSLARNRGFQAPVWRSQPRSESDPRRLNIQFTSIGSTISFSKAPNFSSESETETRSDWPICWMNVDRLVASIKGARPGQITALPLYQVSPFPLTLVPSLYSGRLGTSPPLGPASARFLPAVGSLT